MKGGAQKYPGRGREGGKKKEREEVRDRERERRKQMKKIKQNKTQENRVLKVEGFTAGIYFLLVYIQSTPLPVFWKNSG